MKILGISAYYHDSAAALLVDGKLAAAAQEERFTRRKHDPSFPSASVRYCLQHAGLTLGDLDFVVYYDKPLLTFERLLESYLAYAPRGLKSFLVSMPVWLRQKLDMRREIRRELLRLLDGRKSPLPKILFALHHQSHAASAFYPSPFRSAAVLCMDGVGEWATTSVWSGRDQSLDLLWQLDFPHSLGLLYSAFTSYCGFRVNSGEYKLMGLAPYGQPRYVKLILDHLLDLKGDGTFRLNMEYFDFAVGLAMTNEKFSKLFGGPPREPESLLRQREMDIAASIQAVTEEIVLRLGRTVHRETGHHALCMAGGVALNCVANGRLLKEGPFRHLWVQPASGDAGGAVGAAYVAHYRHSSSPRSVCERDAMGGTFLGPSYSNEEICAYLDSIGAPYQLLDDDSLLDRTAELLADGNVVGWFQGRMEFGPRALGARSILGDPRRQNMQTDMNLKIKFRESFRPFAPAVLAEDAASYFDLSQPSPYMLLVAQVRESIRKQVSIDDSRLFGIDQLKVVRSTIPAVTHVDYSARVQTVDRETNPRFHALLVAFRKRTGCSVLVNTSFNVRGEPIVQSPEDAYRCFMRTGIDWLVMENVLIEKKHQPPREESGNWRQEFIPD